MLRSSKLWELMLDHRPAMNTVRNLLCFVLGAAFTAGFVALLLPAAPWPYTIGDLGMRKLHTVAAASSKDDAKLAGLLRSASMEDGTVIMTFTNEALALPGSLLQIFLESFRTGVRTEPLLKHLVVVATDGKGFDRCRRMHPLCYRLAGGGADEGDGDGLASEASFMSKSYVELMWTRNRFQWRVLALGYGFVFTDVDMVWFRNPLLRIPVGADIATACDKFYGDNPYDLDKSANGGFVYARPSAAAVAFFGSWYEARTRYPGEHDQSVFDKVKHELAARHGATVQLMDTAYFGGNCEFKRNFHQVCTFHANCLYSLQDKIDRLNAVMDEWKQFKAQQLLLGANSTALTY